MAIYSFCCWSRWRAMHYIPSSIWNLKFWSLITVWLAPCHTYVTYSVLCVFFRQSSRLVEISSRELVARPNALHMLFVSSDFLFFFSFPLSLSLSLSISVCSWITVYISGSGRNTGPGFNMRIRIGFGAVHPTTAPTQTDQTTHISKYPAPSWIQNGSGNRSSNAKWALRPFDRLDWCWLNGRIGDTIIRNASVVSHLV